MTRDDLETIIANAVAADRDDWAPEKNRAIARAALSAIEAAGVTLCPNEPTEEMVREGACEIDSMDRRFESGKHILPIIWEKMLSASPLKQGREG